MVHLIPDKKQAKQDADTLINGDLDNAINDPDFAEPMVEERKTHPDDDEDTQVTLELHVGGEHIADVFPMSDDYHRDYADAMKRAGIHIHALLQENARLEATVGRDVFADKQQLIVVLREAREVLRATNYHLTHAAMLESENTTGMYQLISKIDVVLTAVDKQPKEG